jgi:hypothetical protein
MGGACSTYGPDVHIRWRNLREKAHLIDSNVDGLSWIFSNGIGVHELDWSGSG